MTNKRNIWIINQFAGDDHSGWGERHFFLASEWANQNIETWIFSASYTHVFKNNRSGKLNYEFSSSNGVNFCWVKVPNYKGESIFRFYSMLVFMVRLFFLPLSKIPKPDVICVSSMPLFPVIPSLYLKRKLKVSRFVFEVRDFWPLTPVLLGKVSPSNPIIVAMNFIQKLGFKRADCIVAVPSNPYDYIRSIIGPNSKVFHIPNGAMDSKNASELLPEVKAQLNIIPTNKFIVGYAGTFGVANSLENLIDAAHILSNNDRICFVLLGDGYLKDELIIRAKGLSNIVWIDKIPKSQMPHFLSKIDVGIICWQKSKLYELGVSPNKYFDYMWASKPIVLAGEAKEDPAEKSGCAILAEPENPESIALAVLEAFNMKPEQLAKLGRLGNEYFYKHHTFSRLAENYRHLLFP